jgi:hypothetical protein
MALQFTDEEKAELMNLWSGRQEEEQPAGPSTDVEELEVVEVDFL